MTTRTRMTGAANIARSLNQIAPGLNQPINNASRKALRPMLNAAKRNLRAAGNVITRGLLNSLAIKRNPRASANPEHLIGSDPRKGPHYRKAHLVEHGSAPHMIGEIMHPGARAFPFLRPAFEEKKDEAVEIFGREIGPALEKRAAQVAKRR